MLFKRDVNWNPSVVLGTGFGAFCDWYLRFDCPKHVPGAAQDRPDSVCVSVCLSVQLFADRFLEQVDADIDTISRNNH